MNLKYNKRSTEWLRKGVPGKIIDIKLMVNGQKISLDEYKNIEVNSGINSLGAIISLSNGDTITIPEKEFNVDKDKQLHLLFANKNYKILNMIFNPLALALVVLGVIIGVLIPTIGLIMLFAGMVILTVMPNTYVYKKHGSDAFKILLT